MWLEKEDHSQFIPEPGRGGSNNVDISSKTDGVMVITILFTKPVVRYKETARRELRWVLTPLLSKVGS